MNLVIFRPRFSPSVYRQWVPRGRNFSYNLIPIFLKLCTCFLLSLKMCMWFGYNPCIIFCHFFYLVNFVIFWPQIIWKCCDSGYLVSATPHTILCRSLWNFAHVFPMVWRYACSLDIILALIFVTFSTLWTLSFSDLRFCESVYSGYLVIATPHTILYLSFWNYFIPVFLKLCTCFLQSLEMCMWFGYNFHIYFCHFLSHLL